MTRTAIAIPERLWSELGAWLGHPYETAAVLTARAIDDAGGVTLLARQLHPAPEGTYLDRRPDGLVLRSSGWVPAVRQAALNGETPIFVHTHPSGSATFSRFDDQVDDKLWPAFMQLASSGLYISLLIAGEQGAPRVAARVRRHDGTPLPVTSVRVVGDRLTVHRLGQNAGVGQVHDRQVRALGRVGQEVLQGLSVGVVGAGGTGSPVIEQLIRLGVGHVVAIDDDIVTPSTVARGYGTSADDIGLSKVAVMAAHAQRVGLGTTLEAVDGNLRCRATIEKLRHCDAVFSCVDGHAARLVLNRWSYWHLAPVIDVGVLVSSNGATVTAIDGRVTWLAPGAACLLCRGRIDPVIARAEHLDPEERRRLAEQGYVPGLEEPQPSIVPYTTSIAAMATIELLNRLFGLAPSEPTEILVQFHTRTTSLNRRSPRVGCFCAAPGLWGGGLADPYLDLTWPD